MFVSDERILLRILVNLLKNALEASAAGETVLISCRHAENNVRLSVCNSGVLYTTLHRIPHLPSARSV